MSEVASLVIESDVWLDLSNAVLKHAKSRGADEASIAFDIDGGYDVSVRDRSLEQLTYHNSRSVNIVVYKNKCMGHVAITDCRRESLCEAVDRALAIASRLRPDEHYGLADVDHLAFDYPNLALAYPWALDAQSAISRALECEAYALSLDDRIDVSESCNIVNVSALTVYANSLGFVGHYPSTHHSMSLALVAKDDGGMQIDYDYTSNCNAAKLMDIHRLAESAVSNTVGRLGARSIKTGSYPVVFQAKVAKGLVRHVLSAISGSNLYKKQSFMQDAMGTKIFPDFVSIDQSPHLLGAPGSRPFDNEGVLTHQRDLVDRGVLSSFLMGSYSARRLGMVTTGNASGAQNVRLHAQDHSLDDLCKKMGTGLLITHLLGQGVNILTGNYSRGASGFWVERGEIKHPVEEITLAGNLKDMFHGIVAVGNDVDERGGVVAPSILIDKMSVAAA